MGAAEAVKTRGGHQRAERHRPAQPPAGDRERGKRSADAIDESVEAEEASDLGFGKA